MNVYAVAFPDISTTLSSDLFACDGCARNRRPLFLAREDHGKAIGLACDTCLATGRFPPNTRIS